MLHLFDSFSGVVTQGWTGTDEVPALRSSQVTSGGNSEIVNSDMYHEISNSDNALRKN